MLGNPDFCKNMFSMDLKDLSAKKQAFQNVAFQKLMKFANLTNGGTTFQWVTLHAMRKICKSFSLPLVDEGFAYLKM